MLQQVLGTYAAGSWLLPQVVDTLGARPLGAVTIARGGGWILLALTALPSGPTARPLAGQEADPGGLLAAGAPECEPGEAGIVGRVRHAETGLPLPTARLTARSGEVREAPEVPSPAEAPEGREAREGLERSDFGQAVSSAEADPAGAFALCDVEPGRVSFGAEFQGVASPELTLSVEPGSVVERDVVISLGPPGRLEGRVLQGTARLPVTGALVTLDPLGIQMLTDSMGTFLADSLPPSNYRVAVHHPSGLRVDSLEVRPRSRVHYETRLVAREVVLGSQAVGFVRPGRERRAPARERNLNQEERRSGGGPLGAISRVAGAVFDTNTFRRWRADRLSQVLTLIPGMELVRRCVGTASSVCGFLPRLTSEAACQEAAVYLDGQQMPAGPLLRLLDRLSLDDIDLVQVVDPGQQLPESLGGETAVCGAVLVWP